MSGLNGTQEDQAKFLQKWYIKGVNEAEDNEDWTGFSKITEYENDVNSYAKPVRDLQQLSNPGFDVEGSLGLRGDRLCENCGENFKPWQPSAR
ncbi:MAG: hypothetical protein DMF69_24460 [Acidobacteria bacterium]|nr:MAG: hypothetical protein DMF69_24460 [Acidobacteriota bacterium]